MNVLFLLIRAVHCQADELGEYMYKKGPPNSLSQRNKIAVQTNKNIVRSFNFVPE